MALVRHAPLIEDHTEAALSKKRKNSHGGGWGRSDSGSGRTPPPKDGDDCLSWLFAYILTVVFAVEIMIWIVKDWIA